MKTKWQFFFDTKDFFFEEEHKFRGSIPRAAFTNGSAEREERMEFEMSIVPDAERKRPTAEQTGTMNITVPCNYEEGKDVVKALAYLLSERISFDFGELKLLTGMILCERLPETSEERELVGYAPFAVEMSMVEVVTPPKFDAEQLIATLFIPYDKREPLQDALLSNKDFYKLFTNVLRHDSPEQQEKEYKKFVTQIVNGRHRCAHMKLKKDFGYWATDPRVKDEIEPHLHVLEVLTYYAIRGV
jgi:hypothetical protein